MDKPMRWKFWTREATMRMDDKALQQLFLAARTNRAWLPREVPDSVLKELVDTGEMTNRQFHDAVLQENSIPIEMVRASLTKQKLTAAFTSGWKFYGE